jgi:hypothetical protein
VPPKEIESLSALSRRSFLQKSAAGAAGVLAGGFANQALAATTRPRPVVALPSAAQFRADVQRMVDFGPRHPGTAAHNAYVDWLEDEFLKAGLELLPADEFHYDAWVPKSYALDILDGPSPGPMKVAFPYPRAVGTGSQGIVAPLSFTTMIGPGGRGNVPGVSGGAPGSIFVISLPVPAKADASQFSLEAEYEYWPGRTAADWSTLDLTRPYGMAVPYDFSKFVAAGAKAVLIVAENSSYAAIAGSFTPHQAAQSTPIPVFVIDRDTGAVLRQQAVAGRHARLTLNAPVQTSTMRTVTAILPGRSDETIICNTHSDGQNAVEENGGVALVGMARHFGSLPPSRRLKRTLVFTVWSAHMTDPDYQPELDGWMHTHKTLVGRAVAGVTIEHLGCTLWTDDPVKGYHGTSLNEPYAIWTSQGPTQAHATPLLAKHNMALHALLHGPVEFTVGGYLEAAGIPNAGGIAGPVYLVVVSKSGEIEKLDFHLASRQIGFYSDMVNFFDTADPKALRAGDPLLGKPIANPEYPTHPNPSKPVRSGPADQFVTDDGHGNRLAIRLYGRRQHNRAVRLTVQALDKALAGISVKLTRGHAVQAHSSSFKATGKGSSILLRRAGSQPFSSGTYTLVISERGKVLARHSVRV